MPSFNLLTTIAPKLNLFQDNAQKIRIIQNIRAFHNVDKETKGFIADYFNHLTAVSGTNKFNFCEEITRIVAHEQIKPIMIRENQGANFCIRIELESTADFTGTVLTVRNSEGQTLLSLNNIAGDSYANAPVQNIDIEDLALGAGEIYKLLALTEVPDGGGLASGEGTSKIAYIFLICEESIDA